jgi:CheY-like chemotaxis protein
MLPVLGSLAHGLNLAHTSYGLWKLTGAKPLCHDMHILFVDDTFETRDLFRLCFTLEGHTVDTAHNGMEALRIIQQKAVSLDVIILDYHMPQMDGLEVVRQLRRKKDIVSVPIILLTGSTKGVLDDEALELGIDRLLYKPIVPGELIALAQEVAGTS